MDYNSGWLALIDADGKTIQGFYDNRIGDYQEKIFDIGDADLNSVRLAVSGYRYDHVILGPWSVSFTVDQILPKDKVVFTPVDSPYFETVEITYSAITTSLWITLKEDSKGLGKYTSEVSDYISSFEPPYFTLSDGSMIALSDRGVIVDPIIATVDCLSEYFDIKTLHSITFCGEEYVFDCD